MKYPCFTLAEIKSFHQSCQIASQTFKQINKLIRPGPPCNEAGWTEKETASKINRIMKSLGAQGLAFRPIVAAGNHSAIPHHRPTTRKVKKNDIILLDFGCKVNEICSDLSRTIFIGTPKPQWQKVYQIVQMAQKRAIKYTSEVAGGLLGGKAIKFKDLDSIARSYIKSKGYGKNFTHSLGHGIGIQPHQYFSISLKSRAYLKPNMVFTIEPGIYLKGRFGIRIEDVVYLSSKSLQILTNLK